MSLVFRLGKLVFLFWLLVFALLVQRACQPAPAPVGDGYKPADDAPAPVAALAPAVRLVNQRLLRDELRDTSTSARPNLGRKALPRSRWHQAPCSPACVFSLLPRPFYLAEAAKLHKI